MKHKWEMKNDRKDSTFVKVLGDLSHAPDLCMVLTCIQVGLRAESRIETIVSQSGLHLGNESARTQQGGEVGETRTIFIGALQ